MKIQCAVSNVIGSVCFLNTLPHLSQPLFPESLFTLSQFHTEFRSRDPKMRRPCSLQTEGKHCCCLNLRSVNGAAAALQ